MSGGHYSLYRAALGVWLLVVFARVLPGAPTLSVLIVSAVGLAASALFAIGLRDRIFAVVAGAAFVVAIQADAVTTALVVAPLAVHVTTSVAPYGAWEARGRPDPDGGFALPRAVALGLVPTLALTSLALAAWVSMDGFGPDSVVGDFVLLAGAMGYAVASPFASSRAWGFVALLMAVVTRIALVDDSWSVPLLYLALMSFDPRFVPRAPRPTERIFYDGGCGLCHRAVRFVLAEDRGGDAFRFAALAGDTFVAEVPKEAQQTVLDSIVLLTHDGRVLVRSAAILRIMEGLGGIWRVLAMLGHIVPRPVADALYDAIARVRHRLFAKPEDICPIIPKALRLRFDP